MKPWRIPTPRDAFIEASVWHGSLDQAEAILASHPEIRGSDIHIAAILGDDQGVRRFLALDAASATAKSGPLGWDALTHLCFSKFLRLDKSRSDSFVRAATALLDAGASANTGFFEKEHQPEPEWESALYGAAGVAHHAALTRLLLERGADPNDDEVPYHSPETYDNDALKALVEDGRLTDDNLSMMLVRKADWHDYDGLEYLVEHGADPNRMSPFGVTALHQAVRRDNAVRNIELLLDHGADPLLKSRQGSRSAASIAAQRGRGDVLDLLERRGVPLEFSGVERLIAACARNDADSRSRNRPGRTRAGSPGRSQTAGDCLPSLPELPTPKASVTCWTSAWTSEPVQRRRLLRHRAGQHRASRCGLEGVAQRRDAAPRARRARERGRWQGPLTAGAGREGLRGLVLDRSPVRPLRSRPCCGQARQPAASLSLPDTTRSTICSDLSCREIHFF